MSQSLKDLLDQDQLKLLAKRYLNVLKSQDPGAAPSLMSIQSNLAKAIGHHSWHAAQKYWEQADRLPTPSVPAPNPNPKSVLAQTAEHSMMSLGFSDDQAKILIASVQQMGMLCISGISADKRHVFEHLLHASAPLHSNVVGVGMIEMPKNSPCIVSPDDQPRLAPALRLDPSLVAYEEVRTPMHARDVWKMCQSGHSVLTSTGASSAIGALDRFINAWDIPIVRPNQFTLIAHVKMFPQLCRCANLAFDDETRQIHQSLTKHWGEHAWKFTNSSGCSVCNKGMVGRTVCAELVEFSLSLGALCHNNNPDKKALDHHVFGQSNDDRPKRLVEHLLSKVINGEIDAKHLAHHTPLIDWS